MRSVRLEGGQGWIGRGCVVARHAEEAGRSSARTACKEPRAGQQRRQSELRRPRCPLRRRLGRVRGRTVSSESPRGQGDRLTARAAHTPAASGPLVRVAKSLDFKQWRTWTRAHSRPRPCRTS
eukprot:7376879-Prymnesium_polylepis.1